MVGLVLDNLTDVVAAPEGVALADIHQRDRLFAMHVVMLATLPPDVRTTAQAWMVAIHTMVLVVAFTDHLTVVVAMALNSLTWMVAIHITVVVVALTDQTLTVVVAMALRMVSINLLVVPGSAPLVKCSQFPSSLVAPSGTPLVKLGQFRVT